MNDASEATQQNKFEGGRIFHGIKWPVKAIIVAEVGENDEKANMTSIRVVDQSEYLVLAEFKELNAAKSFVALMNYARDTMLKLHEAIQNQAKTIADLQTQVRAFTKDLQEKDNRIIGLEETLSGQKAWNEGETKGRPERIIEVAPEKRKPVKRAVKAASPQAPSEDASSEN